MLMIGKVGIPLKEKENNTLLVVTQDDVKILLRTAMSCRGRISADKELKREVHQVIPKEKYSNGEEEIFLCKEER